MVVLVTEARALGGAGTREHAHQSDPAGESILETGVSGRQRALWLAGPDRGTCLLDRTGSFLVTEAGTVRVRVGGLPSSIYAECLLGTAKRVIHAALSGFDPPPRRRDPPTTQGDTNTDRHMD